MFQDGAAVGQNALEICHAPRQHHCLNTECAILGLSRGDLFPELVDQSKGEPSLSEGPLPMPTLCLARHRSLLL